MKEKTISCRYAAARNRRRGYLERDQPPLTPVAMVARSAPAWSADLPPATDHWWRHRRNSGPRYYGPAPGLCRAREANGSAHITAGCPGGYWSLVDPLHDTLRQLYRLGSRPRFICPLSASHSGHKYSGRHR